MASYRKLRFSCNGILTQISKITNFYYSDKITSSYETCRFWNFKIDKSKCLINYWSTAMRMTGREYEKMDELEQRKSQIVKKKTKQTLQGYVILRWTWFLKRKKCPTYQENKNLFNSNRKLNCRRKQEALCCTFAGGYKASVLCQTVNCVVTGRNVVTSLATQRIGRKVKKTTGCCCCSCRCRSCCCGGGDSDRSRMRRAIT